MHRLTPHSLTICQPMQELVAVPERHSAGNPQCAHPIESIGVAPCHRPAYNIQRVEPHDDKIEDTWIKQ